MSVKKSLKKIFAVAIAAAMVVTAMPMQPVQAAKVTTLAKAKKNKKVALVTTQAELEAALKNPNVKKIKIKTDATVTVEVKTEADIKVDLSEGAEGSSVTTTDETVKTEIKNETKEEVTVTTPAGEEKVESGNEGTTGTPSDDKTDDTTGGDNNACTVIYCK